MKSSLILSPLLLASLATAVNFFKVKTTYEDVYYNLQYDEKTNVLQLTTGKATEFDLNEFFNLVLADDPTQVVSTDIDGVLQIIDHPGEGKYPEWEYDEYCCISYSQPLFACSFEEETVGPFEITTNLDGFQDPDTFCFPIDVLNIFSKEEPIPEDLTSEEDQIPFDWVKRDDLSFEQTTTTTVKKEVIITETVCDTSNTCSEIVTTVTNCESGITCEPRITIRSTTISTYCPSSSSTTTVANDATVVVTVCDESTLCETYNSVIQNTVTSTARTARTASQGAQSIYTGTNGNYATQTDASEGLLNKANVLKSQSVGIIAALFVILLSVVA